MFLLNKIRFAADNIRADDPHNKQNRSKVMDIKSLAKGAAAGAAVGFTYYALSTATPMKKYSIKKNAGKTLKAAGSLLDDIKSVIM